MRVGGWQFGQVIIGGGKIGLGHITIRIAVLNYTPLSTVYSFRFPILILLECGLWNDT